MNDINELWGSILVLALILAVVIGFGMGASSMGYEKGIHQVYGTSCKAYCEKEVKKGMKLYKDWTCICENGHSAYAYKPGLFKLFNKQKVKKQ